MIFTVIKYSFVTFFILIFSRSHAIVIIIFVFMNISGHHVLIFTKSSIFRARYQICVLLTFVQYLLIYVTFISLWLNAHKSKRKNESKIKCIYPLYLRYTKGPRLLHRKTLLYSNA